MKAELQSRMLVSIAMSTFGKHNDTHVKTDGEYKWIRFSTNASCPFCIAQAMPTGEHKTIKLAHLINTNTRALVTSSS
jgi:hypothetical protein